MADVLNAYTQPAATGFAILLKLVDHFADHIRGHGKANPDRPTRGRQDRRVHPDHFTLHVEQRPARVALVNRRIGLQEIVIGTAQLAPTGRDDARGDRKALPQGVAHRHDPIADAHLVAVAEGNEGQGFGAVHLQQRHVGLQIETDQFSLKGLTTKGFHLDLIGAFNDMVVGDDIAISRDDIARAQRFRLLHRLIGGAAVLIIEILEELFKG